MIRKVMQISKAWKNMLILTDANQLRADERKAICNTCSFKVEQLGMEVCGVCHCPLMAKIFDDINSCPKGIWIV